MQIRDRIKELRRVKASELRPNPKNWRSHPVAQRDALCGVLSEVGYADALLAREDDDGSLVLIDGHLRAETTPDMDVPVLVLDVNEGEADKILATLDPLAAAAEADSEKLEALLGEITTESEAVQQLLAELELPPIFLDLGEPPPSVAETVEAMEKLNQQRRKGNAAVVCKRDTEKYVVVVYQSREAKERAMRGLGLPSDERYIPAESLTIRARGRMKPAETLGRGAKSADAKHSGATG